ncbi:MAG TPA: choice-of-anchor B family protein [Saprospiraceae bacterium]|nr:choice-of-anchor B family protein [Saprospiraceae bacterium]
MRITFLQGLTGLLLLITPIFSYSQLNMTLQDSVTYTVGVNDICGWVAPDGKEYALVGLHTGVAIVDVDSTPLKEVAFVPTVNNLWKDINTYGHYAYVSAEANVGILIIDLQYLPDSVETYIWQDSLPTADGPRPLTRAHTLWTDEHGILYLNGSNLNNGGVIMLDVASSPTDPVFLGYAPAIYSHDCYTRDSIIYSAEIYSGNLSIYDAHDPQNITTLGQVRTPSEFTHNAWLSDNSKYMFTTDERSNSYVTSYDITDPGNIIELDRWRQAATEGLGNVVHNVYVWEQDWLLVAYYANGTVIVDGSRPDNLVEVGNFDSFLGADGGFPGVWGTYPWLPSQKILSSDRNTGLYVFEPNYVRACFLEGTVVDSITGAPVDNAIVTIVSDEIILPQPTRFDGVFKMGKAIPGQYSYTVEKEGYYTKTILADFINGEVLTPVVELVPLPVYSIGGKVLFSEGGNVPFAKVTMFGPDAVYELTCDENGDFFLPAIYGGTYELQSGIWGHTYETIVVMDEPKQLTIQLVEGYKDNFDVDLGWTIAGDATSGVWGRGIPSQQLLFEDRICSSDGDSPNDLGGFAYTTGLSTSENVQDNEVSGGTTWLISPPMDLTEAIDPKISFDYWLCEFPPNQYTGLAVWLTNDVDTTLLEELRNDTITGSWQSKSYPDLNLTGPINQVRLMISATDTTSGQGDYILKVHFDKFKLSQSGLSTNDPYPAGKYFVVYPNPSHGETIYLKQSEGFEKEVTSIHMYDIQGRQVFRQSVQPGNKVIAINHQLEGGMYFIQWMTADGASGIEKVSVVK